jgi:hypothetical protein
MVKVLANGDLARLHCLMARGGLGGFPEYGKKIEQKINL